MKYILTSILIVSTRMFTNAQWTGQTSSTDLTSAISRSGTVSINSLPVGTFAVGAPANSNSMTLGSPTGVGFSNTISGLYGLYMGVSGTGNTWIQGGRSDGQAIAYDISLQASGGRVGIGTTSPSSKLTIGSVTGTITSSTGISLGADQNTIEFLNSNYGNGFGAKLYGLDQGNGLTSFRLGVRGNSSSWTDALFVHAGTNGANGGNIGYIGIGTSSPDARLTVSDVSSDLPILKLKNSAWACNQRTSIEFWNGANKNYPTSRIASQMDGCGADGEALSFETQTAGQTTLTSKLFIKNNGYVGIGTTAPDAKLAVKGQVHAQEVKVDLNGAVAPDYVFEKDYKLASLEDIKNYIEQNKHLPEVPSAKEMEKNGVQLGEMNMLLLKKIEELTLYVIELKERDVAQQARIDSQEVQIQDLKRK